MFDIASIDLYKTIDEIFPSDLDYVGDIRTIHYDQGSMFSKNIVQALGSILVIAVLNAIVYGVARGTPWEFGRAVEKHYSLRWLNILNDCVEAMTLPIIFYSSQQFMFLGYEPTPPLYNVLILFLLYVYVLMHPLFVCLYVQQHHKNA